MKKHITLLFFLLSFSVTQFTFGQIEPVGSSDYGRIFDIVYDPLEEDKLYSLSLYNHILVSEDNGENWEVLFSLSTREVTSFRQLKLTHGNTALSFVKYNESSNNNTLMILDLNTLEVLDEIEIPYSSTDRYIADYDIFQADTNIMIMHTRMDFGDTQHTYYTTDGGQNWNLVYDKDNHDNVAISSVAINPNDSQHLILTRGLGPTGIDGGLFQSMDGGITWTEQLKGVVLDPIVFNPHQTQDILLGTGISFGASNENLYRSTDGGVNWVEVPINWTSDQLDNIVHIAFHPTLSDKIVVLEENEIVISNDNGDSWESYVYDTNDVHGYYYGSHLSFNPFNENEVYINSDYHPLFSTDGGVTVTWAKNNFFSSTGTVVYNSLDEEHLYYGVQYGYVHENLTTGAVNSFKILPLGGYTQGNAPSLYADSSISGRVYYFSNGWFGSNLEISADYGENFAQILSTPLKSLNAVATDPFNSNIIWVSLSDNLGTSELKKIDISDSSNIIVSSITLPEIGLMHGILFDESQEGHALVPVGTKIYQTSDAGSTWSLSNEGLEQLDPQEDLILDITRNPKKDDQLTLASNKGIFTSIDGGASWSQLYTSLVHTVSHSTETNGHIVATIRTTQLSDAGIVYSKDGGESWTTIENESLYQIGSGSSTVIFEEEAANVYLGSIDLGLLKYTLDLTTLGTQSGEELVSIQVHPNPTYSTIFLNSNTHRVRSVQVYDLQGKLLLTTHNTTEINIRNLGSGIYILKITTDDETVFSKKVIKQ